MTRTSPALAVLFGALAATGLSAQEPASTPRCATPAGGIGIGATCDTLTAPLPVAIAFPTPADSIPLTRADVEAVFLDALARALRRPVRVDSAWAFGQRGTTHVWAEVEAISPRTLKATMLFWVGQPDHTLDLLCQAEATPDLPFGSTPALAAVLGAYVREFGACAAAGGEQAPEEPVEQPGRDPLRPFLFVVGPLALALIMSLLLWWFVLRRRPPDFWQLAARYPDKAYQWFIDHDDWIVLDPDAGKLQVPDGREFDGPYLFWVPKLGGRRVAVYGRRSAMEESQRAFLSVHGLDSEGLDRS
ncbi:MAG: hypothetical protein IH616_03845 [Gemmatimonadales bacterium]|nr:hypothetical protein [Gemmatimonadales bacterium]